MVEHPHSIYQFWLFIVALSLQWLMNFVSTPAPSSITSQRRSYFHPSIISPLHTGTILKFIREDDRFKKSKMTRPSRRPSRWGMAPATNERTSKRWMWWWFDLMAKPFSLTLKENRSASWNHEQFFFSSIYSAVGHHKWLSDYVHIRITNVWHCTSSFTHALAVWVHPIARTFFASKVTFDVGNRRNSAKHLYL